MNRAAMLLALAACALPGPAHGAKSAAKSAAKSSKAAPAAAVAASAARPPLARLIALSAGKSQLLPLPFAASRLAVGDTGIADVILLNPNEVYLLGKRAGATNLILWDHAKQATIIDLAVAIDTGALRQQFDLLFADEKALQVHAAADTLIISGTVADAVKASQIMALAQAYAARSTGGGGAPDGAGSVNAASTASIRVVNMLAIAAPQQVMLEVKIAEVSKSLVDQLGASLGVNVQVGNWTHSLLSNLLSGNRSLIEAFNNKNGNFITVDAQKRDGLVKILAEPTIMAISGQEASFLAGGKVFIPVSQSNNGGTPTITLEEKEYGVAVKFTPTVLDGGRINLKVAPEVSELNRDGIGLSAGGVNGSAILPSFTTRRAATTVQLFDGQSFAIGGLIKNNVTTNIKALPMLGEIPVLGALFRSSDFQTDRSELVFIVTPHLVKPLPAVPPLPTDGYVAPSRADFFIRGKMEGQPAPASSTVVRAQPEQQHE